MGSGAVARTFARYITLPWSGGLYSATEPNTFSYLFFPLLFPLPTSQEVWRREIVAMDPPLSSLLLNMKSEDVGQGPAHKRNNCLESRLFHRGQSFLCSGQCPVLTVEICLKHPAGILAGLLDGSWFSCSSSPTPYRLLCFCPPPNFPELLFYYFFSVLILPLLNTHQYTLFISLFTSPLHTVLPYLLCKCGLFLSISPPLIFFLHCRQLYTFLLPSRHCLIKHRRSYFHFFTADQPCSSLASSLGDLYLHCFSFLIVWINII